MHPVQQEPDFHGPATTKELLPWLETLDIFLNKWLSKDSRNHIKKPISREHAG